MVAVIVVAVFTVWLGRLDIMDPDEGRHSEIAREMLASGNYLTPQIHGEPYYDKPAPFYWMLAGSFTVLGQNARAARLPSATAALVTIAATAAMAGLAYGATAAPLAALLLATTLGFVAVGRHTIVDMPFTAALTVAVLCLLRSVLAGSSPYPFYVSVGLATVIKGPAALVLLGALALVGLFLPQERQALPARLKNMRPVSGAAVVAALVVPWYLAAWLADPDYIETFLIHHNLARYAAGVSSTHDQPWYYYAVALPLFALPWSPLMAVAGVSRLGKQARTHADLLLAAWALLVIAFFAPAKTKLVIYMMPALPALACMAAAWLSTERSGDGRTPGLLGAGGTAWTVFVAVLATGATGWLILAAGLSPWFATVALLAVSVAVGTWRWQHARTYGRVVVGVAAATLCLLAVAYGGASSYINQERSLEPAGRLLAELGPETRAYAYRCPGHSLAFYAGRPVPSTDQAGEALARLQASGPVVLFTKQKHLGELDLGAAAGVTQLWHGGRSRVMVGRR